MARSYRFEAEETFSLNITHNPCCEECDTPTRTGTWVEDTDGYTVFACSYCIRALTADTRTNLITAR